ncbi:TPA: HAD-IIA family hydrolase, partial [Escherichia coli]|nr:HAD-IIA family hydrolase [Escherichia coli]
NMYSLFLAKKYAYGESFILNNADLAIDSNIIEKICESPFSDLIAVDVGVFNEESMKVTVNDDNKVSNISKLIDEKESVGCSIDFYKFSKDSSKIFFDEIERIVLRENNKKDWTEIAMQRLFIDRKMKFDVLDISGCSWVEIDNYADLALADKIFSQKNKKISDYKCYCFDLDGTVYVGREPIKEVIDEINSLKKSGKLIRFISNNSSKCKSEYVNKLKNYGIDVSTEDIKISSDSVIDFLNKEQAKKIYVVGTKSLQKNIIDAGFEICSHEPDFIVLGYDTELTYSKLVTACRLINCGVDYIATHCDVFCPSENGPIPDIGTVVTMLEMTTGRKPYRVFGKPNPDLLNLILNEDRLEKDDLLMIGDRIYTDIQMAENTGIDSVLVLTGDTKREDIEDSSVKPTYILQHFSQ